MENTGKIFLDDEAKPSWFIAFGDRWIGPLTASDVYDKIKAGEITWAHFVWRAGQAEWKRICDVETFQAAVPSLPGKSVTPPPMAASAPAAPQPIARIWYLHYSDTQFGPFSFEEVSRFLAIGKIDGRVHAWRDGMDNWKRIEKLSEFASVEKPVAPTVKEEKKEQRKAPRRPLVARLFLANDKLVVAAVCRDVSVGGMQVLTDRVPGEPGERLKMNISPAGENGEKVPPFVAEGVIVRVLEDGRGFSFRFERLANEAREALENYITGAS